MPISPKAISKPIPRRVSRGQVSKIKKFDIVETSAVTRPGGMGPVAFICSGECNPCNCSICGSMPNPAERVGKVSVRGRVSKVR